MVSISPRNFTFIEAYEEFLQRSSWYVQLIRVHLINQGLSIGIGYVLSNINFSTYNSIRRRNPTRVANTFETNEYGTVQSGSVNYVFPMLSQYYWSRGMYMSSSSENEQNEQGE